MEKNFELSDSQQISDNKEIEQIQFQHLLADVWATLEKNLQTDAEALQMIKSISLPNSQNFVLKRIESEFNLGPLGDYVHKNRQTLPFLAAVMAQIHQQLHIPPNARDELTQDPYQAMMSFWNELEDKLGVDTDTFTTVDEISENARQVADDLAKENPQFADVLGDVKTCIKQAWGSLESDVEYSIRQVKNRKYSDEAMEKIYARLISKGVQTARQIQDKIDFIIQNRAR